MLDHVGPSKFPIFFMVEKQRSLQLFPWMAICREPPRLHHNLLAVDVGQFEAGLIKVCFILTSENALETTQDSESRKSEMKK